MFLLFVLILSVYCSVFAQDPLHVQIRRTDAKPLYDRLGYNVSLYVSVLDSSGKPVRGLGNDNFKVYEDSLLQTLTEARSAEDEPVSLVLLMDMSGSMLGQNLYNPGAIPRFFQKLSREDRSAVISFNERISVLQRFTSDHAAAANAAQSAEPENGRGSCLYDAIYEGLELSLSQTAGRRAVVLFTDGSDELPNGSICSTRALSDVLNFSIENHIPVFIMGIGDRINEKELERIAETSGGSWTKISGTMNMDAAFDLIYSQMYHEYKLSYKTEKNAGAHTVLAEAERNGSYGKASGTLTLPLLPTIMQFQSPEEGSEQEGTALLSVMFLNQSAAVSRVEYFCNGQEIGKVVNYPYTYQWDLSQIEPGTALVEAIAFSRDNQELARSSRRVIVKEAAGAQEPEAAETPVPTAVPTPTDIPVKEEKTGTNPVLWVCLGGLAAAVIILVIQLTGKKEKPQKEIPVYIPPINYNVYPDPPAANNNFKNSGAVLATLEVVSSDDQALEGSMFKVSFLPLTMGRSPDNDVIFTQLDRAVGRHHAVLEFQNGQIALRDLNSRYGSFINDRKVGTAPVILNSGDMIRLGTRTTLKFIKIITSPSTGSETTNIGAFPETEMQVEETTVVKNAPDIDKTVRVVRLGKNKTGKDKL